ncbi:energy-coupling factor ABC transporter permease [candidate division KSB1 bacterium]
MHIPDGLLHPAVIGATGAAAAGAISVAVVKVGKELEDAAVPQIGILAAFLFVAQMLQFPVAPGISGHLLGGALTAILAGPWAACIIVTTVLLIQCFIFQDGGLLALGANILNMGVIGVFSAHYSFTFLRKVLPSHRETAAIFAASVFSVVAAAAAAGAELGISGIFPLLPGLATISGIHVLIGFGEACITVFAVLFIKKNIPEYAHIRIRQ